MLMHFMLGVKTDAWYGVHNVSMLDPRSHCRTSTSLTVLVVVLAICLSRLPRHGTNLDVGDFRI